MIEEEGNIDNRLISIVIDFGASHIYINPKIFENFKLKRCKHGKDNATLGNRQLNYQSLEN